MSHNSKKVADKVNAFMQQNNVKIVDQSCVLNLQKNKDIYKSFIHLSMDQVVVELDRILKHDSLCRETIANRIITSTKKNVRAHSQMGECFDENIPFLIMSAAQKKGCQLTYPEFLHLTEETAYRCCVSQELFVKLSRNEAHFLSSIIERSVYAEVLLLCTTKSKDKRTAFHSFSKDFDVRLQIILGIDMSLIQEDVAIPAEQTVLIDDDDNEEAFIDVLGLILAFDCEYDKPSSAIMDKNDIETQLYIENRHKQSPFLPCNYSDDDSEQVLSVDECRYDVDASLTSCCPVRSTELLSDVVVVTVVPDALPVVDDSVFVGDYTVKELQVSCMLSELSLLNVISRKVEKQLYELEGDDMVDYSISDDENDKVTPQLFKPTPNISDELSLESIKSGDNNNNNNNNNMVPLQPPFLAHQHLVHQHHIINGSNKKRKLVFEKVESFISNRDRITLPIQRRRQRNNNNSDSSSRTAFSTQYRHYGPNLCNQHHEHQARYQNDSHWD